MQYIFGGRVLMTGATDSSLVLLMCTFGIEGETPGTVRPCCTVIDKRREERHGTADQWCAAFLPLTSHLYILIHCTYSRIVWNPFHHCSCTVQYLPTSHGPHVLNGIFPIPTVHLQCSHLPFDFTNLLAPDFLRLLLQLPCLSELVKHELWEHLYFAA